MIDIALSNFASYFGFFAALNLGYATSQTFRDAINGSFFHLRRTEKSLQTKIENLRAKIVAISDNPRLHGRVDEFENSFNNGLQIINRNRKLASMFVRGFKCMFLITALFSITLLIVCGFVSQNQPNSNYYIFNLLHCLNAVILSFSALILAKSFTKLSNKNVPPEYTTILFLLVIGGVVYFNSNYDVEAVNFSKIMSLQSSISISVFVAMSPYIIHFFRAFIHKAFYFIYEWGFVELKKIQLKNLDNYLENVKEDFGNNIT